MDSIAINDLYKIQDRKEEDKITIYNKILDKFYYKIKYLAKMGRISFHYNLPDIIYGLPLYDKNACICYIIYKLRLNGFLVEYIYPNGININWDKENKKKLFLIK